MTSKKQRRKNIKKAMDLEIREHKSTFIVYLIIRAIVIAVMVRQIFMGNYENVFMCILTLILLIVPSFIQVQFKIDLPSTLEIIILMFIFAAEILGEVNEFYIKINSWDTMLHTMNGFLAAAIGFSMVNLLNEDERLSFNLSPFFVAIVAFCFSMTIGVLWEFFEFFMDQNFNMDMQKDTIINAIHSVALNPDRVNVPYHIKNITDTAVNGTVLPIEGYIDIGLIDTMKDLFVNFIGAVIFSIIGYFYIKRKGKGSFARKFIPRPKNKSTDFLRKIETESEN